MALYGCTVLISGKMETKETLRLGAVSGASGLSNHLVYAPPSASTTSTSVLMFFGGDVQDYPEIMLAHRDNKHYVEWSLTNTARLLATKFPAHHVFVVKPNRMERKTFSCFDNFVMSNSVGAPTHEPGTAATRHLASLMSAGLRTAQAKMNFHSQENDIGIAPHSEDDDLQQCKSFQHSSKSQTCDEVSIEIHDVTLIGFSKGCVVLNQLITEFHSMDVIESSHDELHKDFISKVHNMYWLDGGHAGGSKTWITTPTILKFLASLKHINIHIHVTPYQVRDEQRPWIRKECKAFYDILRRAGAKVYYTLHFKDEPASLMLHFRVLEEFNRN
ncbi:mitochondrial protein C2orf69 homolog isoform X2 [Procambarus clarkii]|uniref:mitochondrial protein C2orf69 homolog isoform X2 n=1 Tax=Procambarus clarkii TaxID=6728 RepID=UPI00374454A8